MLKQVGFHCFNVTKAPEFIEIKFENAVAHGKKEQRGSEKGQEPKFVLKVPTTVPGSWS